ncbi:MAG: hypothetical protein PHI59_09755 [Candidatus Omnitrophica bacterium]|nr:hypothetical protein [Candidatus Omnitrophota bacterium]
MWTIVVIHEDGKSQVLETIIDDKEAVAKYKTLVENRHKLGGFGYKPVYLHWVEF